MSNILIISSISIFIITLIIIYKFWKNRIKNKKKDNKDDIYPLW